MIIHGSDWAKPTDVLTIRVSTGSGKGRTSMAAFDSALRDAGVADHNLIRLSSIIPPGTVIETCDSADQLRGTFGDALYCVYAVAFATERGDDAWSGIGWSRATDGSGRGLFVEHTGHAEEQVRTMIMASLTDMADGRSDSFAFEHMVLSSARCSGQPACSVVVATYRTAGWGAA
ncbi:pyruvoyl-dependent arginine decarboxylase [Micropruina sp.]|uniref:pyruvoyl-dependent arginine decarboxylase n=1 Tax=Micropruina sp. TaxID=2737536 RepID=UPI00261AB18A|nr:pyruvoyl-dependent arginine decarboxylase [Micropruina sp.]